MFSKISIHMNALQNLYTPILLGVALVAGTSCKDSGGAAALGQQETFNWGGQPISFSPPAEGWERGREQTGGQEGIAFIKTGGLGTGIGVVEVFSLGNRDQCVEMQKLREEPFEKWGDRKFLTALQRCQLFTSPVHYDGERALARQANARLDAARQAYRARNYRRVRDAITEARNIAQKITYSLAHVQDKLDEVVKRKRALPQAQVTDPHTVNLRGYPATTFDYQFYEDWRKTTFYGREIFIVANNRLFSATYIGTKDELPVFNAVVDTISFPKGACQH